MTMQPAGHRGGTAGTERQLFTGGPRLGWIFRDRRQAIAPYAEPEPDPQALAGQLTARLRQDRVPPLRQPRPDQRLHRSQHAYRIPAQTVKPTTSVTRTGSDLPVPSRRWQP